MSALRTSTDSLAPRPGGTSLSVEEDTEVVIEDFLTGGLFVPAFAPFLFAELVATVGDT